MDPRIEHLQGPDLEMATAYVEGERHRQDKLFHIIEGKGVKDDAEEGWRLLQVWDRLSLLVCMSPLRDGTDQKLPPFAANGGDVAMLARANDRGELLCDPYPFASDPVTFTIEAFRTPRRTWESEAAYRQELRTSAERVLVRFSCRSG
jgi:hypothetical protein